MGNYVGIKCPVCSKRYAASDDIVVCPICGAPHHRHCYADRGECVFAADHISGKEWCPPSGESAEEGGADSHGGAGQERMKSCSRCGSANPPEILFCQVCGNHMLAGSQTQAGCGQRNPFSAQSPFVRDYFGGVDINETIGELPITDLALYVGVNCAYYLPRFYRFEKTAGRAQPNFAACFFSFFYYFYRKMYLVGTAMLAFFLVCMIPFFMFAWEFMPVILYQYGLLDVAEITMNMELAEWYSTLFMGVMLLNFIANLTLSLFANRIYYKQVVTRVKVIIGEKPADGSAAANDYQRALIKAGGVDRISTLLLGVILFVGSNAVLSVMAYSSNLL